jgi:dCMP deaminase
MIYDGNFKWDTRFLDLAQVVSKYSKDPSTQVGAVIARGKSQISFGWNGFPSKMEDSLELLNNREEKYSRIIHAEVNALLQAKTDLTGCTLYTYPFMCCDRCAVQMIQAGITTFVFPKATEDKVARWGKEFEKVFKYFSECKVEYREY